MLTLRRKSRIVLLEGVLVKSKWLFVMLSVSERGILSRLSIRSSEFLFASLGLSNISVSFCG